MDVRIDEDAAVLSVDDGDETHAFDVVDDRELWYRESDGTSATPPDEVVEELEERGYIVTVDSSDETRA